MIYSAFDVVTALIVAVVFMASAYTLIWIGWGMTEAVWTSGHKISAIAVFLFHGITAFYIGAVGIEIFIFATTGILIKVVTIG